ncbi:MAG TPA: DUF951 domain-containing protein [Firmicutes bacterium]|jgi:hypothetical protein|nr:DUF951 domain-containing protein [Bacillota bacterium]
MVTNLKYGLNDIVEMKRPHPCVTHSRLFKIIRVGADIKLSCQGCGHVVMMTRDLFNKRIKRIVTVSPDIPKE